MEQHSSFYYTYASFGAEQSPLLKAAALYFDKLFILDPLKASSATFGPGAREPDLRLLESAGIFEARRSSAIPRSTFGRVQL